MLLRASSTVGQALFFDSPNRDSDNINRPHLHLCEHRHQQLHLRSFSCNASPACFSNCSLFEFNPKSSRKVFRRAQSDGNLEGLASSSFDLEELRSSKVINRSQQKQQKGMKLHTEPSFSIYNSEDGGGEEDIEGKVERLVKSGGNTASLGSPEFSFGRNLMSLIEDNEAEDEEGKEQTFNEFKNLGIEAEAVSAKPLSPGLVIDGDGVDGGGGEVSGARSFDDNGDVEEYYKRMITEDPSNSLFLRNYAQLLQSKGDYSGAMNYYYSAALADPKDGEIMLQYAEPVRDFHQDIQRAISYIGKATHVAPEDSHVLAAYARSLWEMEEDEEEMSSTDEDTKVEDGGEVDLDNSVFVEYKRPASPPLHLATGLGIDTAGFCGNIGAFDYMKTNFGDSSDMEEYYKMMIEKNPCNPLLLRNYAQFLWEIKEDLQGAEEYYSQAILADPSDGDILLQYAKLIWQRHSDRQKASSFFEQAVQVASQDSNVLAAYARFLWESEEGNDEEDSASKDHTADA